MPDKRLGELIARYRRRPLRLVDVFTVILPGALAVLLPLGYGYSRQQMALTSYGPAAAAVWSQPWYNLAVFALGLFTFLAVYRLWQSTQSIWLFKGGLRLNLGRPRSLRWEQLSGIRVEMIRRRLLWLSLPTHYQAWLIPSAEKSITLPHMPDLPELLTQIKAHLYPDLAARLHHAFKQDQRVYFGPLAIHRSGILPEAALKRNGSQPVRPWDQVQQLTIEKGQLVLTLSSGQVLSWPVAAIPNIELMLEIVQREVAV